MPVAEIATPTSLPEATALLKRVARHDAAIAAANAERAAAIAAANAAADKKLAAILPKRDALVAAIEPWWRAHGVELLTGKRKTVELGGCTIGTKAGATSLAITSGDFDAAATLLRASNWGAAFIREKVEIEKQAVKAGLDGEFADELRALGFHLTGGGERFVLAGVTQPGTLSAKG